MAWKVIRRWIQQQKVHWCFCVSKARKSSSTLERGKDQTKFYNDVFDKKKRETVCQYIGRFFYQEEISFNCANLDSFKWMVEVIGQYDPNMKPPSYHELRVPILHKEVEYKKKIKNWKIIMLHGWSMEFLLCLMGGQIKEIKPWWIFW